MFLIKRNLNQMGIYIFNQINEVLFNLNINFPKWGLIKDLTSELLCNEIILIFLIYLFLCYFLYIYVNK